MARGFLFVFEAVRRLINTLPPMVSPDPISTLYTIFLLLCLDGGIILILCSSSVPPPVASTLLPSILENLRWVLAIPLLLELQVGVPLDLALVDLSLLLFLAWDLWVEMWKNARRRRPPDAVVHAYSHGTLAYNNTHLFRRTFEIYETNNG